MTAKAVPERPTRTLLTASHVNASYSLTGSQDVPAVDDVSLSLNEGEILGLAGESGCGKSTLGNALAMLATPPLYVLGGTLDVAGERINLSTLDREAEQRHQPYRGRLVSMLPQGAMNSISPTLRIRNLVCDVMKAHQSTITKAEALDMARTRLQQLNMPVRVLDQYAHQLSGGMRQRTVTVLSTLLNPRLLIADEPTSALDVSSQRMLIEMLLEMVHQGIMGAVIFITHDLPLLSQVADRLAIMYAGKLVETGTTEEIVAAPRHPYTQALLAAVLDPTEQTRRKHVIGIPGSPPNLADPPTGCRFHPRCPFVRGRDILPGPCTTTSPELIPEPSGRAVACWWAVNHPNESVPEEMTLA
jgi:peptide/nickel transport system ATP-binding protein